MGLLYHSPRSNTNFVFQDLGGFWGAAQNLFVLIAVFFPETDAKTQLMKTTLLRWTLASFHIMCGSVNVSSSAAEPVFFLRRSYTSFFFDASIIIAPPLLFRKNHDTKKITPTADQTETTMQIVMKKAVESDLLSQAEAEDTEGNAVIPLMWMMNVIGDQIFAKKLPGADLKDSAAGGLILKMRSGIGGVACACSSFGLTPLPLVHLMSGLVKMQLFLLAIKEGVEIAGICVDESEGKTLQIGFCVLMLVVTPIIFQGLLEFVIMVNNPFGDDWVDYPIALYHKQIRDELQQYMRAGETARKLDSVKQILP